MIRARCDVRTIYDVISGDYDESITMKVFLQVMIIMFDSQSMMYSQIVISNCHIWQLKHVFILNLYLQIITSNQYIKKNFFSIIEISCQI